MKFRVIFVGVEPGQHYYSARQSATDNAQKYARQHNVWAGAQELPEANTERGLERIGGQHTEWQLYASFEPGGIATGSVQPHTYKAQNDPNPGERPILCERCGLSERATVHQ